VLVTRSLILAVIVGALATRADAEPARAWAAAKSKLPASAAMVMGTNVDAIMGSSLSSFASALITTLGVGPTLESIKTTCGIDPAKAIDGLVMVEGATSDEGAFYLSLDGVDEAAVTACANKLAKKTTAEAPAPAVAKSGAIHEIVFGDKKLYATWIDKDVIAIAVKPGDKAMLSTFTSGKGVTAKSALGKLVAKTNTASTIWIASAKSRSVSGTKLKHVNGGLDLANKTLAMTMTMTFTSATDAKNVAKLANDQIIALLASGQLDAIVMEMLNKVSITTSGADLAITGSLPENQLMSIIGALAKP
jgi:hypothetical protein